MKKIILIILLSLFSYKSFSQTNYIPDIFVSPKFTLGYTFGAGLTYGIDFTFGLFKSGNANFGVSYSYYLVNYKESRHIVKSYNIVLETNNFDIKFGAGEVKKKWGYKRRNQNRVGGLNIDVSYSYNKYSLPWIGLKSFILRKGSWEWFPKPYYMSLYSYFKHDELYLFVKEEDIQ